MLPTKTDIHDICARKSVDIIGKREKRAREIQHNVLLGGCIAWSVRGRDLEGITCRASQCNSVVRTTSSIRCASVATASQEARKSPSNPPPCAYCLMYPVKNSTYPVHVPREQPAQFDRMVNAKGIRASADGTPKGDLRRSNSRWRTKAERPRIVTRS